MMPTTDLIPIHSSKYIEAVMKRWLKIGGITLGALLALVIVIVSTACYLIFTPARLTGIVNKVAAQYLACDMKVKKIDLTLFSSFPNVSLLLDGVVLVNPFGEEVGDTVASINQCEAVVDVKKFLKEGDIVLRRLHLNGGTANLFVDRNGNANFMVFAMETTEEEDTVETDLAIPDIDIQEITIGNIDVTYTDQTTETMAEIKKLQLALNGSWKDCGLKANLECGLRQVAVTMGGEDPMKAVVEDLSLHVGGDAAGDTGNAAGKIQVGNFGFSMTDISAQVNNVEWSIDGTLSEKSLSASTSLSTLPIQITMAGEIPVEATLAAVQFKAEAQGRDNGINIAPTLVLDGLTVYMNREQMLNKAAVGLHMPLQADTAWQHLSFSDASMNLNEYLVKMEGQVCVTDTATMDATLHFETGRWDIPGLFALIPPSYQYLLNGIQLKGNASLMGSVNGGVKEGELLLGKADAALALDHIDLKYNDSINLLSHAANLSVAYNGGSDWASGSLNACNLDVAMVGLADAQLNNVKGNFTVKRAMRVAEGYIDVQGQVVSDELTATMDTLHLYTCRPAIDIAMKSAGSNSKPIYNAALSCDTLYAAMGRLVSASTGELALAAHAEYNAEASDLIAQWTPRLSIDLKAGHIAAPMLALPLDVPHIKFDYQDGLFNIHDSRILLGSSDFSLRGDVHNIDSFLNETGLLKAELDFTSSYTDVTQIMDLVSGLGGADSMVVETEEQTETIQAAEGDPFMVPLGIDVRLNTDITTANVNGFKFDDIGGHVTVKDGILVLEEMGFTADAARMQLTAMYKSPRKNHLFVGFDFHLLDIEIDELVNMIPDVDSIIPMLSAFDGEAQFHLAAETYLKSNYDIKMSTLRAAGAIEGKDLVVMDNETFSQISKYLMFDKKTENVVDSISVELSVFRDKVTLYPFLIAMDDYKAVIGGRHNIDRDLSFDYHISLTDCPLPVRLGLDVNGTLDDIHFKPVACKYAHMYNPEKQNVVQSRTLQLKKIISDSLKDNVKPQPGRD